MNELFYIQGLNNGDEKTFHLIFEMFHSRMCYFARRLLDDNLNSDDVVQEAFVKLWEKRTDFNNLLSVKSFLYTVVRNLCLNIAKHNTVAVNKKEIIAGRLHDNDTDVVIEAEVIDKLFHAITMLPHGCRKVVQLGYFKKMKNQEIAEHLRVSVNTVKTQKKRGLQLLKNLMKSPAIFSFFYFS